MSYRLTHINQTPRGGWKYFQPETRLWIQADHYEALLRRVREHRDWKGLDLDSIESDVVKQICQRLGPAACREYEEWYQDMTDTISSETLLNFNASVFKFLKSGGQLVERGEAQRRADICRSCPFNKNAANCACSLFYKTLGALLPSDKKLDGLEVCSVCGCSLKAKVWLPGASINNGNIQFPEWCWQREI